jgi:sugar/nucleoside kinase (ribokinase family)
MPQSACTRFDVVGLGNAIVDVMSACDEAFLTEWNIARNSMSLIDAPRAELLTGAARDPIYTSGGSGANTIAGIASFGGNAAYFGRVAADALGRQFTLEMQNGGVPFYTQPAASGPATARSIIFVSDDGARSMNTYLGASVNFSKADLDDDVIRDAAIIYLEGYLFDKDDAKAAFVHAAEIAQSAGRKVSLTLSDQFCVDRHRASFLHMVRHHVDVLFANEAELLALYQTDSFEDAAQKLSGDVRVAAITRSEKGSVVIGAGTRAVVPAVPVTRVIDTTGAGDQYAAGFLFGYARGADLPVCARLGHIAAAEVISHFGPRPQTAYSQLAEHAGLMI